MGRRSAWNDFQSEYKGLSKSQVSAMYRAQGGGGGSSIGGRSSSYYSGGHAYDRASQREPTEWNIFQRENAGRGMSPQEISQAYQARKASVSSSRSAQDDLIRPVASERARNSGVSRSWNDFRTANKGKGMSIEELSAAHQAEKRAGGGAQQAAPRPSSARARVAADQVPRGVKPGPREAEDLKPRTVTLNWNDFQAANKGKGWSREEMSRRYHAQFAGGPSRPSSAQAAASATPRATDETSRPIKREEVRASSASTTSRNPAKTLNWNDFQAANKGKGWSREEMSRRYHAQFAGGPSRPSSAQAAASATPRATDETSRPIKREEVRASSASTTSRNPAKTLNWNDFQAANKGKGWSREEMSRRYHAQFASAAAKPAAGPAAPKGSSDSGAAPKDKTWKPKGEHIPYRKESECDRDFRETADKHDDRWVRGHGRGYREPQEVPDSPEERRSLKGSFPEKGGVYEIHVRPPGGRKTVTVYHGKADNLAQRLKGYIPEQGPVRLGDYSIKDVGIRDMQSRGFIVHVAYKVTRNDPKEAESKGLYKFDYAFNTMENGGAGGIREPVLPGGRRVVDYPILH